MLLNYSAFMRTRHAVSLLCRGYIDCLTCPILAWSEIVELEYCLLQSINRYSTQLLGHLQMLDDMPPLAICDPLLLVSYPIPLV